MCSKAVFVPESGAAPRANETVGSWLRVQCPCGKQVKAPASWAGKQGACPQCGQDIRMPDAPAPGDSAAPTADPAPASAAQATLPETALPGVDSELIDLTHQEDVKIVDGVAEAVWNGRRDQRAKSMARTADQKIGYYKKASTLESMAGIQNRWIAYLYKQPIVTMGVSITAIVVGGFFVYQSLTFGGNMNPQFPPQHAYFYDPGTDKLFVQPLNIFPPVTAPSQSEHEEPRGVRAYVYTCTRCAPGEWFIAYLESFDQASRDIFTRRTQEEPSKADIEALQTGRIIGGTNPNEPFVAQDKPEARALLDRATKKCPDGKSPQACEPTEL